MESFLTETMRLARKSLVAFAAVAGFVTCYVEGTAAQGTTTIRLGTLPILTQLPLFTAIDKGYFKDAGLDVQVRIFPGGANVLEALSSNSIDVAGAINVVSLFQAKAQGFDLVAVAGDSGINTKLPDVAMVMTRKDSGINSVRDLAGKRLGIPTHQNINWLYNMEYLNRSGVNPSSITWIETGIPRAPSMLLNKQVDATVIVEPFITVAGESGETKVLYSEFIEIAPGGLISVQAAQREWATANADALRRFVAALKKAWEYNESNQQEARSRLARHTKLDEKLANKIGWPVWKLTFERQDLQVPLDLSVKYGLLKQALPVDSLLFPTALGR